ncbi:DegT/DnrJ/EryC1/StrS family aminotransferase [Formosa sp. S-31]|uniref:DegT/DnrJ/EryC1/StrS family aminotransferase n=1 Tax=Formosa sp. S-31 TaxID=2790949 RepID=UPI003EBE6ECC
MKSKIWLSSPHMGGHEMEFIKDAFNTNWIAPLGPNVSGFENDLKNYLIKKVEVAAVSSGTAALHLALILLQVGPEDEVICQSKTFSASANPIVYQGASPVFVDSERKTWNICPELLETTIQDRIKKGKKPKAIIAVHLYGMPYQTEKIKNIGKQYNIPVIEDSAEALGSAVNKEKCGTFGDLAILSFNGNKIITTSGGGALICNTITQKEKAVFLSTQAKDQDVAYVHSQIGYNYRMSNIIAGIGRGQMLTLDNHVTKRRNNYKYYKEQLNTIPQIEFLNEPEGYFSNRWLTCILLENQADKEAIRILLDSNNIETRPLWKPMHQQPVFKNAPSYINGVSDDLFNRGLCLPSGSNLDKSDLDKVITLIQQYFG